MPALNFQRCLLVTIPILDAVKPPGVLPILAACCETAGVDYEILDLNLWAFKNLPEAVMDQIGSDFHLSETTESLRSSWQKIFAKLHQKVLEYQPNLIAMSVFSYLQIVPAYNGLKYLRTHCNGNPLTTVLGGLGVSSKNIEITGNKTFGEYALHHGMTDFYISGEGELSFVQLLKGNFNFPGINGMPAQQIMDLDQLPSPNYTKIDANEYFSVRPAISLIGSKGCVRSCSFCDVPYYWKNYVFRSGEKIADDMYSIWLQTGADRFDFSDSLINGSIKNFRAMNRRLIELKTTNSKFRPSYTGQFICRPIGQMKFEDYVDAKNAGIETLVVGIEHFSHEVRKHMKKHFDNAAIDWHFQTCARLGIQNVLLLLSGYLTEQKEDHQLQIEYLKRYQPYALTRIIYSINIHITGLILTPHTPLADFVHQHYPDVDINTPDWVIPDNPELTAKERLRRGVEVAYTAAHLGYNLLHFNTMVSIAAQKFNALKSGKTKIMLPIQHALPSQILS